MKLIQWLKLGITTDTLVHFILHIMVQFVLQNISASSGKLNVYLESYKFQQKCYYTLNNFTSYNSY